MVVPLPDWLHVDGPARWRSSTQERYADVLITVVDHVNERVQIVFVGNTSAWKGVSFEQAVAREGPLQPQADLGAPGVERWQRSGQAWKLLLLRHRARMGSLRSP